MYFGDSQHQWHSLDDLDHQPGEIQDTKIVPQLSLRPELFIHLKAHLKEKSPLWSCSSATFIQQRDVSPWDLLLHHLHPAA